MSTVWTNGVETYYERKGGGPPLIFIHAAVLDAGQWKRQVEALRDEYTTIVYDVRGHGRTGGSAEPSYTIERFAEDLDALITALDVDRPVLCGLSMGGLIAQTYAAAHPDRIAGLILADTFTPRILTRGEWFLRRVVLTAVVPPVRLVGYERVERVNVWISERFFSGIGGDYDEITRLREDGRRMKTDEFAKVIHALTTFHETSIDLSAITVPTLVLYGEHELPFIKRHVAELTAHLPNVAVEVVPGAGHASNLDAPERFTRVVQEFLMDIDRPEREDSPDGNTEARGRDTGS